MRVLGLRRRTDRQRRMSYIRGCVSNKTRTVQVRKNIVSHYNTCYIFCSVQVELRVDLFLTYRTVTGTFCLCVNGENTPVRARLVPIIDLRRTGRANLSRKSCATARETQRDVITRCTWAQKWNKYDLFGFFWFPPHVFSSSSSHVLISTLPEISGLTRVQFLWDYCTSVTLCKSCFSPSTPVMTDFIICIKFFFNINSWRTHTEPAF